jgi:hypothetical protein
MLVNADRFQTSQSRLAYLASRLEGPAYAQVLPYIKDGVVNLLDFQDGLQILDRAFGDPNRINNARKELLALRQANREFGQFFAEFHRLALEAQMSEDSLQVILESSLSRELRDQLISVQAPSTNYHAFANFCQDLDNRRRYYQSVSNNNIHPRNSSPLSPRRPPASSAPSTPTADPQNSRPTNGEAITVDNIKGRSIREPGVREYCVKNNLCFYCKEKAGSNHNAQSCPNKRNPKIREVTEVVEDDLQSVTGGAILPGNEIPLR